MEEGLVPICFEKLDCVGGLWSYTSAIDRVCVRLCAMIRISNTSKEMTYVSDSPMPKPVFQTGAEVSTELCTRVCHSGKNKVIY